MSLVAETFNDRLRAVAAKIPDLMGASLIGSDGLMVDSVENTDPESLEPVAAELTSFLHRLRSTEFSANSEFPEQFVVSSSSRSVVMTAVTADYYLLLLVASRRSLGRACYEARRAAMDLEKEFL